MKHHSVPQAWLDSIRDDPDSKFSKNAAAVIQRLNESIVMPKRPPTPRSQVGSRLLKFFSERIKAVPCSRCKETMVSLNNMTVEEILSKRDLIVHEIEKNAAVSKVAMWAQFIKYADEFISGGVGTRIMIGRWLDEACDDEVNQRKTSHETPVSEQSTKGSQTQLFSSATQTTQKPVSNRNFSRDASKTVVKPVVQTVTQVKRIVEPKQYTRPDADWAVAVTTAPRGNENTLAVCLDSLITAGWYDPVVFAEPGSDVPRGIKVIHNETKRGCWHNWLYSATHTLANTSASIIMTVQDDSLFHPDSREFVEAHCLWPTEDTGIVSLYTASHYSELKPNVLRPEGINEVFTRCWWGTCAVVWKREVLQAVVDHDLSKTWLGLSPKVLLDEKKNPELRKERVEKYYEARRENPSLINNSDYVAGHLLNTLRSKMFFVDPSPVQHVSRVSTLKHGGNTGKRNCLRCADHSIPLVKQVGTSINLLNKGKASPLKYPAIIKPGPRVSETPVLNFLVRSSYSDPKISRHRWELTKQTLLTSLAAQTDLRFSIELICSESDELRDEKLRAFQTVTETTIATNDWYNRPHDGLWRRVSRIDDDDIIAADFVQMINDVPCDGVECLLSFPCGYMLAEDIIRQWDYPPNMFCTVQTNTRFTPYHMSHRHLRKIMPTVAVSNQPSWVWVRHTAALSFSERKSKRRRREIGTTVDNARFPYDMPAIQKLCATPETPLKISRAKNYDKDVCGKIEVHSPLTMLADKYETHKGASHSHRSHQYAIIYERLFSGFTASVAQVLEIGIGTSLHMWAEYFPNAVIHGLDRRASNIAGSRIVTHRGNAIESFDPGVQFDLIVDDASHVSSEQRKAFEAHGKHVKPGGYYVIESLHSMRMQVMTPQNKWIDESPDMLETCRQWALTPPNGWDCVLYGDQLCVLQKKNTQ